MWKVSKWHSLWNGGSIRCTRSVFLNTDFSFFGINNLFHNFCSKNSITKLISDTINVFDVTVDQYISNTYINLMNKLRIIVDNWVVVFFFWYTLSCDHISSAIKTFSAAVLILLWRITTLTNLCLNFFQIMSGVTELLITGRPNKLYASKSKYKLST